MMQLTREDVIRILRQELAENLGVHVDSSKVGANWRRITITLAGQVIAEDDFDIEDDHVNF